MIIFSVKTKKSAEMWKCGKHGKAGNAEMRKVQIVGMWIAGMRTDVASTYVLRPCLGIWCP